MANGKSIPTTIDTLTPLLRLFVNVKAASSFKNKIVRLIHMARVVLWARPTDIVLIDTYSTLAFYYAWLCARICKIKGVKYMPYLHGGNLPQRVDNNSKWLNKYFDDASLIITPSTFLKDAMEQRGYGPVNHIPNFIKIHNYPVKIRNRVQPKILWVRSFHSIYNPEMAIYMLAELRKTYAHAQLCMVGPDKDGSLEKCRALSQTLKVQEAIKFTGRLSKEEWIEMAAEYDFFINTTNYDNMPVSVIEAMALGLIVISTNAGGIPFLLDDEENGLLVNKNEHAQMAKAIIRVIDDPVFTVRLSRSARKKAEGFDWDNIKKFWKKVIEENV